MFADEIGTWLFKVLLAFAAVVFALDYWSGGGGLGPWLARLTSG